MLEAMNIESVNDFNPVEKIGGEWMLITAGNGAKVNTMTANWGSIGFIWGKPSATIYIRQTRYTKEFVDKNDYFSLCFFSKKYKKELSYLGSHSGRDENKIEKVKFDVNFIDGVPYFKQASTIIICKKVYAQAMKEKSVINQDIVKRYYDKDSMHTLYIGEIKQSYLNK